MKLGWLCLTILTLFSQPQAHRRLSASGSSALVFLYLGPSDKPVAPLVITDSSQLATKLKNRFEKEERWEVIRPQVIPRSRMEVLISVAKDKHSKKQISDRRAFTRVRIIEPDGNLSVNLSVKRTSSLLSELGRLSEGDPSLHDAINQFQRLTSVWEKNF